MVNAGTNKIFVQINSFNIIYISRQTSLGLMLDIEYDNYF